MDFTEYLYQKIGKRVKMYRKNKGEIQEIFSKTINRAAADKYHDNNIRTSMQRSNISKIENGKCDLGRSFLTNNQIIALSATLNCTETELLLGNKSDVEEILKILLFKCLLSDSKIEIEPVSLEKWRVLFQKSQMVSMQSNENNEKLGNIIIKFLLTYPSFQNHFITTVFYYSDDYPKKFIPFKSQEERYSKSENYRLQSQYVKNWETINSQLQDWYISDTGNIISILLRKPENIIYIFDAFDRVVSKIIGIILDTFQKRFTNNLNQRGKNNTSSKMIDYLETDKLFEILSEDDMYYYLSEKLRREQIDKENSLFHIQFLQLLQYQNLLFEKIHSEYRDTTQSYDKFKLYSDLTKLIKFYEEPKYNHFTLYIDDFIDQTDY
ncbi:TPA: hypothetical protein U1C79_000003 [Streptococcus suis]|nr:hypothetical protein [Streptococcus suis]HEM3668604.1 hypothetical protein [Streptococcus suis]HEM3674798.1 hypothetical protein [Streptococcus suis]HEM3684868.1 hypothetical protein [Streptococcus suis]HEM3692494.1 hypothetical protein [Streptococcus suis]